MVLRVLSVTSEYYPLIKTGGLADVAGALPDALRPLGVEMRTLLPAYPSVLQALDGHFQHRIELNALFGGPAHLLCYDNLLLLQAPHLFDRPGNPYLGPDGEDWPDNDRRFAALSFVAHEIGLGLYASKLQGWQPDLIHGHDWQAGLTAAYLAFAVGHTVRPATVLTVHNLAFQGLFDADRLEDLRLPVQSFRSEGLEFYGKIGFLKAGLVFSDAITTVSASYAREIQTTEHGMGLDGLIHARRSDLFGIVNGIDDQVWDPSHDPAIPHMYQTSSGKSANRLALQQRMGLEERQDGAVFCVISRLTRQKGLDLLLAALDVVLEHGGQLALLGSGDSDLETGFLQAARDHPGQVGCVIGYDEPLAHLLHAGSDAIIIPSRFEPCGLTQLCALRYGTIPIVARVGGLADTVIDANVAGIADKVSTGVQFLPVNVDGLRMALERYFELFANKMVFSAMRKRAMSRKVGWQHAAKEYVRVYRNLITNRDRPHA